eukprot:2240216-Karenia_brevis.AAC.1
MHVYKGLIRSVALNARNAILELEDLPESRDCILNTCSRVVMSNDVDKARFLIERHAVARE